MIPKCAPPISASSMPGEPAHLRARPGVLLAALMLAACGAEPGAAAVDASDPAAAATESVAATSANASGRFTPDDRGAAGRGELKLSGPASSDAIAAVLAEAKRQGMRKVEVSAAQSFRLTDGAREVAALVTGEGDVAGAPNAGCFVAISRAGNVELIPTIGYGDYEAETCGGPVAVGLLSLDPTVRIGVIHKAYSPNTELVEPLVIEWNPSDDTLLIDTALSRRALDGGATTIAAMRRILG